LAEAYGVRETRVEKRGGPALLIGTTVALALVLATVLIHYEVLRVTLEHLCELPVPPRLRIVVVVLAAFAAHLVALSLYALAYEVLASLGLGTIVAARGAVGFAETLYFSAATYSTVGYGDLAPEGASRLVAAVEGLNGLVLIGWSASFTYVAMEKYWPMHAPDRKA
jgi:voltage-gated potassium channel Kch